MFNLDYATRSRAPQSLRHSYHTEAAELSISSQQVLVCLSCALSQKREERDVQMFNTVFFLVFSCVFAAVVLMLARDIVLGRASRSWPVTRGRVLESSLGVGKQLIFSICTFSVRYAYTVDGATYESTRLLFGLDSGDNSSLPAAARRRLERYPPEATVEVHYDPARPARAVLETGASATTIFYTGGYLVFCACCVWVLVRG